MKRKLGAVLLVVALAFSLGLVPTLAVRAQSTLPNVVWLPPLANQGEFQLKDGSTLPIKFTLLESDGSFVNDPSVQVAVNKVLFRDGFERTELEPNWTVENGDWAIESGELSWISGDPGRLGIILDGVTAADGIFEYKIRPCESVDYGKGMYIRYDALTGYTYWVEIHAQQIHIYKYDAAGWRSVISAPAAYALDGSTSYTIRIVAEGANLKVYFDDEKKIDYTDPTPLTGEEIGFRCWQHAYFDDVMVLALAEKTFSYGEGNDNVRISYDTVFSDDFGSYLVEADGSPVWTPVTGDWNVENDTQADGSMGQVYSQNDVAGTSAQRWSLAGDASWTDYVVEAKVKGIEGHYSGYGDNTWDGLVFRAADDNHFYEYYFRTTSQDIIVVKHDGATRTVVSGAVPFTCQNGVWYTLKVIAEGNSFRFYANDVEIAGLAFTDSDSPFTSGRVGVYVWDGTHAHFDDVSVQVPHYIANLHTKEIGMDTGYYLITVWSGDNQLDNTYLFDLTDAIQGKGRGKGKA